MQEFIRRPWVNRFDDIDPDIQLNQLLADLEKEGMLKSFKALLSSTSNGSSPARYSR